MAHKPVVLVVQPLLAPLLPLLAADYDVVAGWEDGVADRLPLVEALVAAGEFPLPRAYLESMPRLRLIACFTVGYDGVDMDWARAHGIAVCHASGANADDVADHAIGMILGHRREIVAGHAKVCEGRWTQGPKRLTRSLGGARLGIMGLGAIGMAVARRAEVMRMDVRWWGPRARPDAPWPRADSLMTLARDSDIMVLAPRVDASNIGAVDAAVMDALGPQGLLVNVARGQLVDEDALIAALKDGRLGGAALDVFWQEPTDAARWADVPHIVLTPHGAGATDQSVARMTAMLLDNLKAHFSGQALPTPVC